MSGSRGPRRPVSIARRLSERSREDTPRVEASVQLGGMFDGLKGLVEGLGKLAQEAQRAEAGGKDGRVVVGYSIRTLDGAMQAFGHVPQPRGAADPAMPEARTPIVDVFEEADAILVVAEVPGVDPERLTLAVEEDALLIAGEGPVRYRHRVALPAPVDAGRMQRACRNGILEVRLPRRAGGA